MQVESSNRQKSRNTSDSGKRPFARQKRFAKRLYHVDGSRVDLRIQPAIGDDRLEDQVTTLRTRCQPLHSATGTGSTRESFLCEPLPRCYRCVRSISCSEGMCLKGLPNRCTPLRPRFATGNYLRLRLCRKVFYAMMREYETRLPTDSEDSTLDWDRKNETCRQRASGTIAHAPGSAEPDRMLLALLHSRLLRRCPTTAPPARQSHWPLRQLLSSVLLRSGCCKSRMRGHRETSVRFGH